MEPTRVVNLEKRASKLETRINKLEREQNEALDILMQLEKDTTKICAWLLLLTGLVGFLLVVVVGD